ncbi:hypothetical protein DYB37_002433 [Aphanomyces astaci]|uniref:Peptidase M1 leukotriene A4 hydrolase/aminopeptidase C-terminal domain-containing protein n=1 Tax=Aphanomyces astaci TaxID=112090 RepID=A0A418FG13_APHAT|nr:hypothetical protein DYB37_002433 [Aphanomyces astaci]
MCNLRQDKHSLANVDAVRVSHIDLTLAADFERRALHGHVALTSSLISPTNTFVLDSKALVVHRATVDDVDASFRHVDDAVFGTALHVTLPALALGVPFTARIYYETTPESTAVQWLPKEQTADKTHPYLFTQCQAIHARSLLPCQDCPLASSTYSAAITVPSWATCLVSAVARADPVTTGDVTTFSYHQAIAVPSYLIAIVIGALESREIGPRSRVWCEPSLVDAAAYEFAQTESFLQHAEAIMNQAYVWGRYDLVCLPPSFPLGGMENPCLTFATPTLLAGDQSLADVIAHEIAHSWTGNLITNHTWEDFWLNEGWTMWLQRKIMARIHSPLHFDFDASIGWNDLQHSIDRYGAAHEFTKLVPTLDGCDPDDAFSSVPYEKGFNFLYYLSKVVGDDQFELFAKAYVQHFKYKTVTSDAFKAFFIGYFTPTKATELATIDWQTWFYGPGMPPKPAFDTTISAASAALAQSWLQGGTTTAHRGADDVAGWTSSQVVAMLDALLEAGATRHQYLDVDVLQSLGDVYHLVTTKNAEIRMRFQTLCIRSEAAFILPYVEAFLKEQGRMKFVRPLFRDLVKSKIGETHARRIFAEWKGYYHPICRSMVEKDLA